MEDKNKISGLEDRIKELEKELQKAKAEGSAKSQFLSYMNHELRTPLFGVVGYLDLITPEIYEDKDELFSYINGAKNSATSCLDLINNILDLAKIESGKAEIENSDFSLYEMIDSALGIVTSLAAQKKLPVVLSIDKSIPPILIGDAVKLRQVIVNILRNAINFTEQGSITLKAENTWLDADSVNVLFSVTDTGIGIPKAKIDQLFKPFSQITGSATKTTTGSGLGLIISKEIVNLLGGDISLESEDGKGSRFFFTLKFPFRKEYQNPLQS